MLSARIKSMVWLYQKCAKCVTDLGGKELINVAEINALLNEQRRN